MLHLLSFPCFRIAKNVHTCLTLKAEMLMLLRNHCLLLPVTHGPLWPHFQHLFPDTKRDTRLFKIMTEREGKYSLRTPQLLSENQNPDFPPLRGHLSSQMHGIFITLKAESDVTEVD